jgi:diguanylate cyclase
VQQEIDGSRAAQLLEANEQLMLTALRAEQIADTAMSDLAQLVHSAHRDELTHTPTRALMGDRMDSAIARARRNGSRLAVAFIDLDGFKQINDTLGHAVGDAVLAHAARRLESAVRDTDTVSRYGGDEFLVLLAEVAHAGDADLIAAKMLAALSQPTLIGEHEVALSASLGIALYPDDGEDAAALVERADAAMYRAKRRVIGSPGFDRPEHAAASPAGTADVLPRPGVATRTAIAASEPRLSDLREANQRLVLAALTAQDLEAQAQATHRQQVKFLAMVAHELRNPLSPIRTAAELLRRAAGDELLLARLQGVIKRQVDHMTRLVEDLLDGSRVSAGKFSLEHASVDLADALDAAVESCRAALERRHQRLTLQVPDRPLRMHGDAVRLAQVVSNLLDNASKYTPQGGEIALALVVQERRVEITVTDNGVGIAPETLPHIFDLYMQDARALAASDRGGLGIGLAVVRELVEAHGGSVIARSAGVDLGSEFVVSLPIDQTRTDLPQS